MADKGQNPAVRERREGLMERRREVGGGEKLRERIRERWRMDGEREG